MPVLREKFALGCATLLCLAAVTACGDDSGGSGEETEGKSPPSQTTSQSPKPPAPRGPVLKSDHEYQKFEMQIVSAELTTKRLEDAPLDPDESALRLTVVARSPDPARATQVPLVTTLGIAKPGCEEVQCAHSFEMLTDFYPENEVDGEGQGHGGGQGSADTLKGGIDYYADLETVVSTRMDLQGARLCDQRDALDLKSCVPLGKVTKGPGV